MWSPVPGYGGALGPWQGDKLMGPELGAPGDVQLELWLGLRVPVPAGYATGRRQWSRAAGLPGLHVALRCPVGCPPWRVPLHKWRSGAGGKCRELAAVVATLCNDGPSLCFSAFRRGRAQL